MAGTPRLWDGPASMEVGTLLATIDRHAPAALARHGVPGLAVGVLARGERGVRCYGIANLDTSEPVRPETQFRIASITKPHVAMLALRLVELGRLSLDEPLTGLRLPQAGLTLRYLLSHQTGLAADWPKPLAEYGDGKDALERLAAVEPVPGLVGPGELFAYSNPGYWLAGVVLERAAGMPLEDALRRHVLDPLGMERTGFEPEQPVAAGHADGLVTEPPPYPRARRPSGGLFSTAADLLRSAAHQLGGAGPLKAESLREMQTRQVAVHKQMALGLGIGVGSARGRRTLEHGGELPGFRSQFLLVPDDETALVLLTNSDRGGAVIEELLAAVDLAERLPTEVTVPATELEGLAGTYREPLGAEVVALVRDGGLDLAWAETDQFTGERVQHPATHLRPVGGGRFVALEGDSRGESAEFLRGGGLLRYAWLFERI